MRRMTEDEATKSTGMITIFEHLVKAGISEVKEEDDGFSRIAIHKYSFENEADYVPRMQRLMGYGYRVDHENPAQSESMLVLKIPTEKKQERYTNFCKEYEAKGSSIGNENPEAGVEVTKGTPITIGEAKNMAPDFAEDQEYHEFEGLDEKLKTIV